MKPGRFGQFGGQYIPETLMNEIQRLDKAYTYYKHNEEFQAELKDLLDNYANRPSLLYYAGKMTEDLGGAKIYLKREDLNHTGAHKINNALGQCLLAKKMDKTRVIAETGAGQHGVATATAAAFMGLNVKSSWAKKTRFVKLSTFTVWNFLVRKSTLLHPVRASSKMQSTKLCANGLVV